MAASRTNSKFFDNRWESDRLRHFFFLDTPAYAQMKSVAKHWVLKGHRGTGKTTLLKAFHWRERLDNQQLVAALGGDAFADQTIGCYIQLKALPVKLIDDWLLDSSEAVAHLVISTYLKCKWIEEATEGVEKVTESLSTSQLANELAAFSSVAEPFWDWIPASLGLPVPAEPRHVTLRTAREVGRSLAKAIEQSAAVDAIAPGEFVASRDLIGFASLVGPLFLAMERILSHNDPPNSWVFRVCMDEGEFLSDPWARSLRTLMRESEFPVYLAVSVLQSLGSDTHSQGADISIDDNEVIDLDSRAPEQMVKLINGILTARLLEIGHRDAVVDIRVLLGETDVDELLVHAIKKSEVQGAKVKEIRKALSKQPKGAPPPPLVRSYLEEVRAIPKGLGDRRAESMGYRKKKVAGYLHCLGSLGIGTPKYAGWQVAAAMSDNSVRDFLRFLRYAMDEWASVNPSKPNDPAAFLAESKIPIEVQDSALKKLGDHKLGLVPQRINDPLRAENIIRSAGAIVHFLEFYGSTGLSSPNATRLSFRSEALLFDPPWAASFGDLVVVLVQCASYGYIADLDYSSDDLEISFRLNHSLARTLGFSYWKPQYTTSFSMEVLHTAASSETILSGAELAALVERSSLRALPKRRPNDPPTLDGLEVT